MEQRSDDKSRCERKMNKAGGDVSGDTQYTLTFRRANMFGLKQDGWRLSRPHLLPSGGGPDGLLKKSSLTGHSSLAKNIEL